MKSIRKKLWGVFVKRAPKTRFLDRIISLLLFVRWHGRLPRVGGGMNDALHYLKITDEILDPLRVFVSDKEHVKHYIRSKIGERHNVPTFAVLRTLDEAMAYTYPRECVIKPTHLSGHAIIRRNGEPIDFKRIRLWLHKNYYVRTREANYRYLRPKIIVEPIVFGPQLPDDYKIFCVKGRPALIMIDSARETSLRRNFLTPSWEEVPARIRFPHGERTTRPTNLGEMLGLAEKLSEDFSFIRVDFYTNGRSILCGELTNCQGNALRPVEPAEGERLVRQILFGEHGFQLSLYR